MNEMNTHMHKRNFVFTTHAEDSLNMHRAKERTEDEREITLVDTKRGNFHVFHYAKATVKIYYGFKFIRCR